MSFGDQTLGSKAAKYF